MVTPQPTLAPQNKVRGRHANSYLFSSVLGPAPFNKCHFISHHFITQLGVVPGPISKHLVFLSQCVLSKNGVIPVISDCASQYPLLWGIYNHLGFLSLDSSLDISPDSLVHVIPIFAP
jgi:hypothetical protein